MEKESIEQSIIWNNGLCREFAKAVHDIIKAHKISHDEYDLEHIALEIIRLHKEIFDADHFND
ncbi:MAG: hypothetical protein M1324_03745 [Patescibacteria group bacterium]|nr:hypothetical protein [Patescibacteria group bacterium]